MFAVLCIDYQTLCRYAYVLYGALLLSLMMVLLFGRVVNGRNVGWCLAPGICKLLSWRNRCSSWCWPAILLTTNRRAQRR